jgi:hypothetical protein
MAVRGEALRAGARNKECAGEITVVNGWKALSIAEFGSMVQTGVYLLSGISLAEPKAILTGMPKFNILSFTPKQLLGQE